MSIKAMNRVWAQPDASLRAARRLVLLALANRADDDTGQCWPGHELLAKECGLSVRSVQTHLEALEAGGWISRERNHRRADVYTVLPAKPSGKTEEPTQPERPAGKSGSNRKISRSLPETSDTSYRKISHSLKGEPSVEPPTEPPTTTTAARRDDAVAAISAMASRGVDNGEELLQLASPAAVLGACAWWDSRKGVGPGLLAKKIRQGGIEPSTESPSTVECEPADETYAANWERLLERLRAVRPAWSPAFAGSHAHGLTADGRLNIAVRPDALGWARGRCANGHLTQLTHLTNLGLPPIAFVGCERATAVSEPDHDREARLREDRVVEGLQTELGARELSDAEWEQSEPLIAETWSFPRGAEA